MQTDVFWCSLRTGCALKHWNDNCNKQLKLAAAQALDSDGYASLVLYQQKQTEHRKLVLETISIHSKNG